MHKWVKIEIYHPEMLDGYHSLLRVNSENISAVLLSRFAEIEAAVIAGFKMNITEYSVPFATLQLRACLPAVGTHFFVYCDNAYLLDSVLVFQLGYKFSLLIEGYFTLQATFGSTWGWHDPRKNETSFTGFDLYSRAEKLAALGMIDSYNIGVRVSSDDAQPLKAILASITREMRLLHGN